MARLKSTSNGMCYFKPFYYARSSKIPCVVKHKYFTQICFVWSGLRLFHVSIAALLHFKLMLRYTQRFHELFKLEPILKVCANSDF